MRVNLEEVQYFSNHDGQLTKIVANYLTFDRIADIKKTAQAVNTNMFELISSKEEKERAFKYLDLDSVMKVLEQYLIQGSVDTKVAVLKWIHHLFTQAENEVIDSSGEI